MSEPTSQAGAAALQKAANAATYGGSGTAVFFGMTANEIAAIGGLIVAIVGLVVSQAMNWYFKAQHLKIARETAKASEDE